MSLKRADAFEPTALMAVRQTITIRASMTAYSTAVGPSSETRKFFTLFVKFFIFFSLLFDQALTFGRYWMDQPDLELPRVCQLVRIPRWMLSRNRLHSLAELSKPISETTKPRSQEKPRKFYLNEFAFFFDFVALGTFRAQRLSRNPRDFHVQLI